MGKKALGYLEERAEAERKTERKMERKTERAEKEGEGGEKDRAEREKGVQ